MDIKRNLQILNILKQNFGETLTEPVIKSSISFCNYWDEFNELYKDHKLQIIPDVKRLAQARGADLSKKTRPLSLLNFLLFITGIVFLFFNWKISIIFVLLIMINYFLIQNMKRKLVQNEIDLFNKKMINKSNDTERFMELIIYYSTGGIQLVCDKNRAFLPLLPETCLTGVETYPHEKYDNEKKFSLINNTINSNYLLK